MEFGHQGGSADLQSTHSSAETKKRSFKIRFCQFYADEFSCKAFGFTHSRPNDFISSQWSWLNTRLFTAYRGILALVFLVGLVVYITVETDGKVHDHARSWFLFATNWSLFLFTLTISLLSIYCLVYNCASRKNMKIRFYQPLWCMYTVAVTGIVLICVLYWAVLMDLSKNTSSEYYSRACHTAWGLLALVDVFLSGIPVHLLHVIYPFLFTCTYLLFTYLFWVSGTIGPDGRRIFYDVLNWACPRSALKISFIVLGAVIVLHVMVYLIFQMRVKATECCNVRGSVQFSVKSEKKNATTNHNGSEVEDRLSGSNR